MRYASEVLVGIDKCATAPVMLSLIQIPTPAPFPNMNDPSQKTSKSPESDGVGIGGHESARQGVLRESPVSKTCSKSDTNANNSGPVLDRRKTRRKE